MGGGGEGAGGEIGRVNWSLASEMGGGGRREREGAGVIGRVNWSWPVQRAIDRFIDRNGKYNFLSTDLSWLAGCKDLARILQQ